VYEKSAACRSTSWFLPPLRLWKRRGKQTICHCLSNVARNCFYVINLQTLKSILKSAQKCDIFTFKIQKFYQRVTAPSSSLTPFVSPQFAPLDNSSHNCEATLARSPCMFLSPEKATSDPELCQSRSHGTTCDITRHLSPWLLQFCARWPSCIYPGASATCTEYSWSTNAQSWPAVAHYSSTAAVAMAARQVPHHLQDRDADDDIPHNRCPSYLIDLVAFNTVVAYQSSHRETDTDPIR